METASIATLVRQPPRSSPLCVSFSGIDGAGKTTQIEDLLAWLKAAGLRVHVIRFWDEIASFRRLRENLGHALFRGEKGVGAPGKPVRRRDKDVRGWYMLPVRMFLCLFDSWSLARAAERLRQTPDVDVVIFDRYIYDQFANFDLGNRFLRSYVKFLLKCVPQPDVAFLLDAEPESARERKPEYPLEFVRVNREHYRQLSTFAGMKLIPPGTPHEVKLAVGCELIRVPRLKSLQFRLSSSVPWSEDKEQMA